MSKPAKVPRLFILALVAGPMPWNLLTGNPSTKAGPISGEITYCPFGLRVVRGQLREELVVACRGVQAGLGLDSLTDAQRYVACERNALQVLGYIQIGFVQR